MVWLVLYGRWSDFIKTAIERRGCQIMWHDDFPQPRSVKIIADMGDEEIVKSLTRDLGACVQDETFDPVPVDTLSS